ncbi:unnamed protein product [Lactuca saligna]|uniref:Uncharacterized protein n=1 Tax=Lactuca saligna TaxID=75948 RepID=A0AA35YV48_LACSI|nr:unnamed protein product [Lactuca saligna]
MGASESTERLNGTKNKGKEELRQESDGGSTSIGVATTIAVAAAGVAVAAWGIASLLSDNTDSKKSAAKMMKAPGRSTMIPRDKFEADPKGYLQKLSEPDLLLSNPCLKWAPEVGRS